MPPVYTPPVAVPAQCAVRIVPFITNRGFGPNGVLCSTDAMQPAPNALNVRRAAAAVVSIPWQTAQDAAFSRAQVLVDAMHSLRGIAAVLIQ